MVVFSKEMPILANIRHLFPEFNDSSIDILDHQVLVIWRNWWIDASNPLQ